MAKTNLFGTVAGTRRDAGCLIVNKELEPRLRPLGPNLVGYRAHCRLLAVWRTKVRI